MDNLKIALLAGLISVLLGVGAVSLIIPNAEEILAELEEKVGALTGPDISSPWLRWGGAGSYITPITCATATSTVFAIQNPWSATSTATLLSFGGDGNATSTDLDVGTSTTAVGLTAATVSNHLVDDAVISTTSKFYIASGVTVGPDSSHVLPGTLSKRTIMVGPSQYVSGFATSTYGDAGAINYSGSFTNCTGFIEWIR